MDAQQKQDLRAIDVADSGDDRLIQQQRAHRRTTATETIPELFRPGILRTGDPDPSRVLDRLETAGVDQFTTGRTVQIK